MVVIQENELSTLGQPVLLNNYPLVILGLFMYHLFYRGRFRDSVGPPQRLLASKQTQTICNRCPKMTSLMPGRVRSGITRTLISTNLWLHALKARMFSCAFCAFMLFQRTYSTIRHCCKSFRKNERAKQSLQQKDSQRLEIALKPISMSAKLLCNCNFNVACETCI